MTNKANDINGLLGELIRRHRRATGLTQQELAERLNMEVEQLNNYEQDNGNISAETLLELSRTFDIPVRLFFMGSSILNEPWSTFQSSKHYPAPVEGSLELVRVFCQIKDPEVRKWLIAFADRFATSAEV